MKKIRYKRIFEKCKEVDLLTKKNRKKNMPKKWYKEYIKKIFPNAVDVTEGSSACKVEFKLNKNVVLKYGNKKCIKNDLEIYKLLGKESFAKVYWSTNYLYLQKFGRDIEMTKKEIKRDTRFKNLRKLGKKHNIIDIRTDNVRLYGKNTFKIIDANMIETIIGLFMFLIGLFAIAAVVGLFIRVLAWAFGV